MNKILLISIIIILSSTICFSSVGTDGVDDVITVTDNATLRLDYITISLWLKVPVISQGSNKGLIAKRNTTITTWYFFVTVDNKFSGQMVNEAVQYSPEPKSTTVIRANVWYHFCMTYDGTTIKTYVNSVLESTAAFSGALRKTAVNLTIGQQYSAGYNINGVIEDMRIYDRALTIEEIKNVMYRYDFANSYKKDLLRFYSNNVNGRITYDMTGKGNNGKHTGTFNGDSMPPILISPIFAGD